MIVESLADSERHLDRGPGRPTPPVPAPSATGAGRARPGACLRLFLLLPERTLTQTAHERLATVAQHTEIGAGMYVALKDLEIRGAGNLLGGEQSGHIAAGVGFDLYVRMIGEAVSELNGEGPGRPARGPGRTAGYAHIPHDYLPGERRPRPGGTADRLVPIPTGTSPRSGTS